MTIHPSAAQLHDFVLHPDLYRSAVVTTGYIGRDIRLQAWHWPVEAEEGIRLLRLDADSWTLVLNAGHYAGRELAPETRLLFTVDRTNVTLRASVILTGPFQGRTLTERAGPNRAVEVRSDGYTRAVITAEREVGVRRDPLAAYTLNRTSFCARKHVWCAP